VPKYLICNTVRTIATDEHRLVYIFSDDELIIVQYRYCYNQGMLSSKAGRYG